MLINFPFIWGPFAIAVFIVIITWKDFHLLRRRSFMQIKPYAFWALSFESSVWKREERKNGKWVDDYIDMKMMMMTMMIEIDD